MSEVDEAPGWDAIDAAIAPLVGDTPPKHWGTGTHLPEQDGIWGLSAYPREGHWFYVTYGLSELFAKVSEEAGISGWGEELTLRTLRLPQGAEPPEWPVRLLARLGELVFERETPFWPGGRIEIPDAGEDLPPALCWADDPELGEITTPFGSLRFVATVGISLETLRRMRDTTTEAVLTEIRSANPLLIAGGAGSRW